MDQLGTDSNARIVIRTLTLDDHARIVAIDKKLTGRSRGEWFKGRLNRALSESDVCISLGAEIDGILVGALLGSLQYGEFGQPQPLAVMDTILVDPGMSGHGVGRELLDQLVRNLRALGIEHIRTEVDWTEHGLTAFLGHAGFKPVPRLVLELAL